MVMVNRRTGGNEMEDESTRLLRKFNLVTTYTSHSPDLSDRTSFINLLDKVSRDARHVFLGEPHLNGNLLKTYEMLARNPAIFGTVSRNSMRHLALEFSHDFQRHLDKYAAGGITREDFRYHLFQDPLWHYKTPWLSEEAEKEFHEYFIMAVDNAIAAGLSVHFADFTCEKFTYASPPDELVALESQLVQKHKAEGSETPLAQYVFNHILTLPRPEQIRLVTLVKDFEQKKLTERSDDSLQYNYLSALLKDREGILGVVGFSHLDNSMANSAGIVQCFRAAGQKVVCVELYDKRATQNYFQEWYRAQNREKRTLPQNIYIMEENAVFDSALTPV